MEGFKKFDLGPSATKSTGDKSTVKPIQMRNKRKLHLPHSKVLVAILAVLIILGAGAVFTIVFPAIKLAASARTTLAQAKIAAAAAKQENIQLTATELAKTRADLTDTQKAMNGLGILKFIPIGNWYYNDGQHLIDAGFHGLDAADILVASVEPYADVLGLKGQGSFVGGSAEQRIQTAVKTMGKITPKIDDIAKQLTFVRQDIDAVNPNHYPSLFGGDKVKTQLASAKQITDQADTFVNNAQPLIKILPELLGEPTEKKYLVIFQNDKELRPTGGFITAYAVFRIDQGVIHVDRSSDIYELDDTIRNKPKAPTPIHDYLPAVPLLNLRDTNLSPDFKTSMDTFYAMYKTSPDAVPVSGIIAVNTNVLVAAMNILGDIQADGVTFTTKTDPRCNCPDVIYQLEAISDQPVNYVKTNRKGIIGDLMYAIMTKAFSSSPKKYWGPLFQTMITQITQKDLLLYVFNQDAQSGIDALNASGKIVAFDGDYLHINEANFGGAKSNLYVTETVNQKYTVNSDGTIQKVLTINYKNPFPPSDCNLERGGLCLNATLRDWIRVYVPKGSQMTSNQGSEVKMTTYDDLGKTVFDGFLEVRPQGSAQFTVTYTLPFKASNGVLPLLIQKQPGTNADEYSIMVNGVTLFKFPLLTDTEEKIKL